MSIHIANKMPPEDIGELVADRFKSGERFVHLQDLSFHNLEETARNDYIQRVSTAIGAVVLTHPDDPGSGIWKLDSTTSPNLGSIPYHTDNPFYQEPEKIVAFWSVKSSAEGGENVILPAEDIFDRASSSQQAAELIERLESTPMLFSHEQYAATAPILGAEQGTVRFDRRFIGLEILDLAVRFDQLIRSEELLGKAIKLKEGDALFFDNHRVLHAREPYQNPDRVSYRVRINPDL